MDGKDVQWGAVGMLGTLVAGLLGWRGISKVKTDNASESRQSRYEDNVHQERRELLVEVALLRTQAERMKARLVERDRTVQALLDILMEKDPDQRRHIERWLTESQLAPFED